MCTLSLIDNFIVKDNGKQIHVYCPFIIPFRQLDLDIMTLQAYEKMSSTKKRVTSSQSSILLENHNKKEALESASIRQYVSLLLSLPQMGIKLRIIKHKRNFIILGILEETIDLANWIRDSEKIKQKIISQVKGFALPVLSQESVIFSSTGKKKFYFVPKIFLKLNKKYQLSLAVHSNLLNELALTLQTKLSVFEDCNSNDTVIPLDELFPYLFSTSSNKFGLAENGIVNVHGTKEEREKWLKHSLNNYQGRLLCVGSVPKDIGNFSILDLTTLKIDFLKILRAVRVGQDITVFGNFFEQLIQVPNFTRAFRKFIQSLFQQGYPHQQTGVQFSKLISSLAHSDVASVLSDKERRIVYFSFLHLNDYSFLDAPDENDISLFNMFAFLWHKILTADPVQTMLETFLLLKFAVFNDMPYNLLVIADVDLSHFLTHSNLLEVLQAEFPTLRIVLCHRLKYSLSQKFHQLILGKALVNKFFPEIGSYLSNNVALYHNPTNNKVIPVYYDNSPLKYFENEYDEFLLEEGTPLNQEEDIVPLSEKEKELLDRIKTNVFDLTIKSEDFLKMLHDNVAMFSILELFPGIKTSLGFELKKSLESNSEWFSIKGIDIPESLMRSITICIEAGFVILEKSGYSDESNEYRLTKDGYVFYLDTLQKIFENNSLYFPDMAIMNETFQNVENIINNQISVRQLPLNAKIMLWFLKVGYTAYIFGIKNLHIPPLLLGLYRTYNPRYSFTNPTLVEDRIVSDYHLEWQILWNQALETHDYESGTMVAPPSNSSPSPVENLPLELSKTPIAPIKEIIETMIDSQANHVILPTVDLTEEKKISLLGQLTVSDFLTDHQQRLQFPIMKLTLHELGNITNKEIIAQSNEKLSDFIIEIKTLYLNLKTAMLFSKLQDKAKLTLIAAGFKPVKSALPSNVLIPISDENRSKISQTILSSTDVIHAYYFFYKGIIQLWARSEEYRRKITKKHDSLIDEWLDKVKHLPDDTPNQKLLLLLRDLLFKYQEIRGGMFFRMVNSSSAPYLVKVAYVKTDKIWIDIEKQNMANAQNALIQKLNDIAEYRS